MFRKTVTMMLLVMFLLTITGPVTGHNGVIIIPNTLDPGGEEHPWGGGQHAIIDPLADDIYATNSVPRFSTNFFVDFALQRVWISATSTIRRIVFPNNSDKLNSVNANQSTIKDVRNR
ncbi:MAG: hypothetical protein KAR42_03350 [candidate division Zixibacteria bacterium]|nr:hypothetical protein [candidate division Zixibacteria bacterium]